MSYPIADFALPDPTPQESQPVKRIVGLALAVFITMTATACGGDSKKKDAAESAPASATASHSAATGPADEEKIVYHDAVVGNDVTVKTLRKVIAQMPKGMTCEEILTGGKALGNTYPNGEDLFLRVCKEVPRK
jgi:hypothetical protein